MNNKNVYIRFTISASLILLISALNSGCATKVLEAAQGKAPIKDKIIRKEKVFSDQVFSYGLPTQKIPNHEYAIAMAGEQYSYLIEPINTDEPTLFHDFFKHVDTRYLGFTTVNQEFDPDSTQAESIQELGFTIANDQVKDRLSFVFIKPITALSKNEMQRMQKFKFNCKQQKRSDQKEYLICQQLVDIKLTVTTKAQNSHQLRDKFRDPLIFNFYQITQTNKYNVKKALLMPLAPITIAFDIVTFPVLLGFAALGIEGPASAAIGSLF